MPRKKDTFALRVASYTDYQVTDHDAALILAALLREEYYFHDVRRKEYPEGAAQRLALGSEKYFERLEQVNKAIECGSEALIVKIINAFFDLSTIRKALGFMASHETMTPGVFNNLVFEHSAIEVEEEALKGLRPRIWARLGSRQFPEWLKEAQRIGKKAKKAKP